MNNWPYEFAAEYHRQRIVEAVEQIRMERLAEKSHQGRPGVWGRTVLHLGDWLIATGRKLHQRYGVSSDPKVFPTTN